MEYNKYKKNFVENIEFDPSKILINGTGKFGNGQCIPPREKEYAPLQLIHIYFDTGSSLVWLKGPSGFELSSSVVRRRLFI